MSTTQPWRSPPRFRAASWLGLGSRAKSIFAGAQAKTWRAFFWWIAQIYITWNMSFSTITSWLKNLMSFSCIYQRIEAWWSFLRKSNSSWWINYFKVWLLLSQDAKFFPNQFYVHKIELYLSWGFLHCHSLRICKMLVFSWMMTRCKCEYYRGHLFLTGILRLKIWD